MKRKTRPKQIKELQTAEYENIEHKKSLLSCLSLNEESMMYLCLTLITLVCLKVWLSSCMEEKMQPDPSTQTSYSIHPAEPQYR